MKRIWEKRKNVSVRRPKKSNIAPLEISNAHRSCNPISESSDGHARTMGGDQEEMNEGPGALGEEIDESSLDRQRGGEKNHQDSDMQSLHESEALVTAAIAVESNPTTVDPQTDQAAAGVVSIFNVGKRLKSYSP